MADRDFKEADAVRVMDAFEAFRSATSRQMQPADLGTIQEAARHRRRWRGYPVAVIASLLVLLPSGIALGLAEAGSHRASPAPAPTASATPSPLPSPSPSASVVPQNVPTCLDSDLSIALVAGGPGLSTWHALIGFTNISSQPCMIGGYPKVVAIDTIGASVSGQANPNDALVSSSSPPGAIITLGPGEQVGADISAGQIDVRGQSCPSYQWLRVTAPGGYRTWEISSYFGQYAAVCGGFGVSPLYPRAAFGYNTQAIISPPTSASPATTPCRAAQLTAHETYAISNLSNGLTIVALYNISTTACYLNGYVTIDAETTTGQPVPITVTRGGNYYGPDPGPTHLDLPPGGAVSFAIGSGTAYGGGAHIVTLTRLTLTLPGGGGQLQVATTIGVTRPSATGPYPLSETALVAGPSGPNT